MLLSTLFRELKWDKRLPCCWHNLLFWSIELILWLPAQHLVNRTWQSVFFLCYCLCSPLLNLTTLASWPWWHDSSQARGSLRPQETILLQGIIHCPAVLRHILQPKAIVSGYNSSLCVLGILFFSWGHAADSCVPFVIKTTKVVRRLCWGWPHLSARWGQQTAVVARRVSGV